MAHELNKQPVHKTWQMLIDAALAELPKEYLFFLKHDSNWLPGHSNIFNAFSLPLDQTKFILFGESPYPRKESANGYAFWDACVDGLWSEQGLAKRINRAVSLRHLIKMLLVARGDLSSFDLSQQAISQIDKTNLVKDIDELFQNFLGAGIMLLNACLALTLLGKHKDAKAWQAFMQKLLEQLAENRNDIQLILFGRVAEKIMQLPASKHFKKFCCEHPYNHSFVVNEQIINFFRPFDLLKKSSFYHSL